MLVVVALATVGVVVAGPRVDAQNAPPSGSSGPAARGDVGPGAATYAVGRRTIEVTSEPGRTVTVDVLYPADPAAVVGLAAWVDPVSDAELARVEVPVLLVSGALDTTTPIRTQTERAWKRIPAKPFYRVDPPGRSERHAEMWGRR
jgi:pimeloyl-ACP methyl ester carboxylesterase